MKKIAALTLSLLVCFCFLAGCGSKPAPAAPQANNEVDAQSSAAPEEEAKEISITVFAAKSLSSVMDELILAYQDENPAVSFRPSYDSSGTLMTQIQEGAECDVFFSAAQKQMNTLEEDGLIVEGTRADIVNNQVCLVTYKDSQTTVTTLAELKNASSIALADGSVPVGKYTRQALMNAGIIEKTDDPASVTTEEISAQLGGVEINECANVGFVASAVSEGANEVGTVYYSDTFGYEDQLEIIEMISYDLTGNVIYPAAQIKNDQADEDMNKTALDFVNWLRSDAAKAIFEKYHFDTNV